MESTGNRRGRPRKKKNDSDKYKVSNSKWITQKLDLQYLLDSGLLFEINRSILHLFGIALSVVKKDDELQLNFIDRRNQPETLLFSKSDLTMMKAKLQRFLDEFGYSQDKRRCDKLGWGCQSAYLK